MNLDDVVTFIDDVKNLGTGRGGNSRTKKVKALPAKIKAAPKNAIRKAVDNATGKVHKVCTHRGVKRGQVCGNCQSKII